MKRTFGDVSATDANTRAHGRLSWHCRSLVCTEVVGMSKAGVGEKIWWCVLVRTLHLGIVLLMQDKVPYNLETAIAGLCNAARLCS